MASYRSQVPSERSVSSTRSQLTSKLEGLPLKLRQCCPRRIVVAATGAKAGAGNVKSHSTSLDEFSRVVKLQRCSPAGDGPTLRISEDADEVILGRPSCDQVVVSTQKVQTHVSDSSGPRTTDRVAEVREIALLQLEGLLLLTMC